MSFITDNLTNFGLIGVIAWQAYQQVRSGNTALTSKMLADYKTRNEQLEGIIKNEREASEAFKTELNKIIADYKIEVTRLRTQNDEKDAHNKALKELLQDKNPDVLIVLTEIRDFLKTTDEQNKRVLGYQTEILEEWKERSNKVDEASKAHVGEPMLVPAV